ncbi:MAG: hypothetical protein ACR2KS_04680 [Candidatus Eremiobacter antarcticus]|nr:hypothetical protein [Candidatus Eremiobacteraeota bacterium]MBC5807314.1 hypothetical protein [Candidatus Eremiobacteraeota bacterium]
MRTSSHVCISALVALSVVGILSASPAQAFSGSCPTKTSLFGSVQSMKGSDIILRVASSGQEKTTAQVVSTKGASMMSGGMSVKPGAFLGAVGCYNMRSTDTSMMTPNSRFAKTVFQASQITLAQSASSFPKRMLVTELMTGTLHKMQSRTFVVQTESPHGSVLVKTSQPVRAKDGDMVTVRGAFSPNGTFTATKVEVNPSAPQ